MARWQRAQATTCRQGLRIVADAEQAAGDLLRGVEQVIQRAGDVFSGDRPQGSVVEEGFQDGPAQQLLQEGRRDAVGALNDPNDIDVRQPQGH